MNLSALDDISDDEVFFGEVSLKEIKKRIFLNNTCDRQSLPVTFESKNKTDDSLQIIETHSEPNGSYIRPSLNSPNSVANASITDWDIKPTDDSFLKLEKMVSEMCMSPKSYNELDNTLEVVEYILNNPISTNSCNNNKEEYLKHDFVSVEPMIKDSKNILNSDKKVDLHETKIEMIKDESDKLVFLQEPPSKISIDNNDNNLVKADTLLVPTPVKKTEHVFKTPKNICSTKKHVLTPSSKKTPNKVNAYQHITSPIAFYIKNCPQVPLIKDVHLKKPLNNSTSIPRILKSTKEHKINNKENISLPSVAYKGAKQTKMISIPDTEKLPPNQWVRNMSNSLPKPVVIKHSYREGIPINKYNMSKNEDSFVGLPLKQADLSVCTKKSAFTKTK